MKPARRGGLKQPLAIVCLGTNSPGINGRAIRGRPGYRIYLAKDGDTLIILFGGGTKRTQQRDIDKAKELLAEFKARKKAMAYKTSSKHKG